MQTAVRLGRDNACQGGKEWVRSMVPTCETTDANSSFAVTETARQPPKLKGSSAPGAGEESPTAVEQAA